AGLQRLRDWLVESTPILEVRSALLIKAHSLWLAGPQAAVIPFREHERYHAPTLTGYWAGLRRGEQQWGGQQLALLGAPRFGDYLTLTRGVGYEREFVGWLRWVIAILEARAAHGGRRAPE